MTLQETIKKREDQMQQIFNKLNKGVLKDWDKERREY